MIRPLVFAAALCIAAAQVQAHEFWIAPERFEVPEGEPVAASFRNGEKLRGSSLSFLPNRSERFDMVVRGETRPVPARIGDDPAFAVADLPEGLVVIVHETAPRRLTYADKDGRTGWERFVAFTGHKAMRGVLEAHRERGLAEEGVTERYRRFAKALVAVGDGAGADAPTGMLTEIVAEANPYADDLSAGLPVRVLMDGAPRADAQVELFEEDAEGVVSITKHRTDAEGRAVLPVKPGHSYLADAVAMRAAEGDAQWESLWAALTFAVPGA